jgi:hypothetical protein
VGKQQSCHLKRLFETLGIVVAVSPQDQILLMSTVVQELKEYCCNCDRVRLNGLVIGVLLNVTAAEMRCY